MEGTGTIKQGAEARLYLGNYLGRKCIVKVRFRKSYRHPELDDRLTKERMRGELRGLLRSKNIGIRTPTIYMVDGKQNAIYMEYVENAETVNVYIGRLLQGCGRGDCDAECSAKLKYLAVEMGKTISKIHSVGIIHGDLTTSNVLVETAGSDNSPTLCLIDFGLSHVENAGEDKAVDLYVLERALISTFSNIPWFFDFLLQSYRTNYAVGGEEVYHKLEEVRLRGRKRTMVG